MQSEGKVVAVSVLVVVGVVVALSILAQVDVSVVVVGVLVTVWHTGSPQFWVTVSFKVKVSVGQSRTYGFHGGSLTAGGGRANMPW